MSQWEYQVIRPDKDDYAGADALRIAGLEGWELVTLIGDGRALPPLLYFKRVLPPTAVLGDQRAAAQPADWPLPKPTYGPTW